MRALLLTKLREFHRQVLSIWNSANQFSSSRMSCRTERLTCSTVWRSNAKMFTRIWRVNSGLRSSYLLVKIATNQNLVSVHRLSLSLMTKSRFNWASTMRLKCRYSKMKRYSWWNSGVHFCPPQIYHRYQRRIVLPQKQFHLRLLMMWHQTPYECLWRMMFSQV